MKRVIPWILAAAIPATASAQENDTVRQKLETIRVSPDFKDVPLGNVIDWIREISGVNVMFDKEVSRETPITMVAKDVRAQTFLNLVCAQANLGVLVEDGILKVLPKDKARPPLRLEIYDVRSLTFALRDFPGNEIEFGEEGGFKIIPQPPETQPGLTDVLEELIKTSTGRKAWEETPEASLQLQNGLLFVRQTPEMQAKVRRFLLLLGN